MRQVAELGRLVEDQLLVSSSALSEELLAAFLCAGAKGVISLDGFAAAAASLDPAAAAAYFSALHDALQRGAHVCQVCKQAMWECLAQRAVYVPSAGNSFMNGDVHGRVA